MNGLLPVTVPQTAARLASTVLQIDIGDFVSHRDVGDYM